MGLALDANLALMLRCRAHMLVSVLKHEIHRLALKLESKATQACIFMLKYDFEVCVLKSSMTIAFSTERNHRVALLMNCDVRA